MMTMIVNLRMMAVLLLTAPDPSAPGTTDDPPAAAVDDTPTEGPQAEPEPPRLEPEPEPEPKASNSTLTYERPTDPSKVYEGGAKWTFGSEGQNSLRFITWHQVWLRYTEMNPGSQVQSQDTRHQFDIGLRRSRMLFFGQFGGRFLFLTHIGINNQTFNGERKPQLFVHEAVGEVRAVKQYLYIGAGLHFWQGLSRMTNASTLGFMGLDAPIFNFPLIERADQFARNLGVYAKGKIGLFDYRVAVNKPFASGDPTMTPTSPVATDNPRANSMQIAGYFMFQILDKESNTLPYLTGTYLGGKKVFNVGVGFQWLNDAVWWQENNATEEADIIQVSADLFLDMPMPKKLGALTAYAAYYYYNFGPDYLRMIGIMNLATGGTSLNGAGNAYPVIGTGHHFFGQVGYMLPYGHTGLHRLQPYFSAQVNSFEALDQVSFVPEIGMNWFLLGHNFKLTGAYRSRPIFTAITDAGGAVTGNEVSDRRSEFIFQTQVFF